MWGQASCVSLAMDFLNCFVFLSLNTEISMVMPHLEYHIDVNEFIQKENDKHLGKLYLAANNTQGLQNNNNP
jgi:hypothetical protein